MRNPLSGGSPAQASARTPKGFWSDESGSYVLEVALVLPLYLVIVFGFILAAVLLFLYGNATFASRSAIRYAVVHSNTSSLPCSVADLSARVLALMPTVTPASVTTSSTWVSGNTVGSKVTITVQIANPIPLPLFSFSSLVISATAQGVVLY